jgi:hypothetical protein
LIEIFFTNQALGKRVATVMVLKDHVAPSLAILLRLLLACDPLHMVRDEPILHLAHKLRIRSDDELTN